MTDPSPDTTLAAFDLPPGLVYLNCAGQTPRLRAVQVAGAEALQRAARPWTESMDQWLARPQRVRALAAGLIGCETEGLALVPSVAYGMALAASCLSLRSGQTVLTLAGEHPSGVNIWQTTAQRQGARLQQLRRADGTSWTESLLAAIDQRVALVVTPACHWHDGRQIDLQQVARAARAHGAALVVDATQALGVLDLNLAKLDADFVMAAGHKWLLGGPGLAYLHLATRHRQAMPLEQHAWGRVGGLSADIIDGVAPDYIDGAARFDGSAIYSHPALAMAEAGLSQLQDWGMTKVRERLRSWQQHLLQALALSDLPGWTAIVESANISALVPPQSDSALCQALAQALHDQQIVVAARGQFLRVSPYLHNAPEDAERLCTRLSSVWRALRR